MNTLLSFLGWLAYVLAISFQLTAAALLVGHTNIKREKIIKIYSSKHRSISFRNDGSLLSRSELEETVNSVWINRIAFRFLFFGYSISVFGRQPSGLHDMTLTLVFIALFTGVFYYASSKYAEKQALAFLPISKDELSASSETGVTILEFDEDEL